MARRRPSRLRFFARVVAFVFVVLCLAAFYTWATLPDVGALRTQRPGRTAFMQLRESEAKEKGVRYREVQTWLPYRAISPNLKRAVLVAEDAGFWDHDGVDMHELRASFRTAWERRQLPRGASTITQQLAKNLYLSPSRNPYRKVVELVITRRLEAELSKTRIFELYLNVVEWGDGIWGAEAASRAYFGRSAAELTPSQAALLAGALINARVYSPARPNARLRARQRLILARMGGDTSADTPPPATSDLPPLPIADETLPQGLQTLTLPEAAPETVPAAPPVPPAEP